MDSRILSLSRALVPIGDSFSSALERQRARATGGAGIERGREGKRERIQNTQLRISEVLIQSTSINQSYNPSQRCSSLYSTDYFSFISFGTRVCVCACLFSFFFWSWVDRNWVCVWISITPFCNRDMNMSSFIIIVWMGGWVIDADD